MGFTDAQIKQLEAGLDPNAISERKQGGIKLSYLEGYYVIEQANKIFGFDNWGYTVQRLSVESEEDATIGVKKKPGYLISAIAVVEVHVNAGDKFITRQDVGFGSASRTTKADCYEMAYKEAVTDALKRSLRSFGNQFGNCLYDKEQKGVASEDEVVDKAPKKTKAKSKTSKDYTDLIDELKTEEEFLEFRREYKDEISELEDEEKTKVTSYFKVKKSEVK